MSQSSLNKHIGLWSATSLVIGSVVGSSIFMKPATMAAQVGSPVLLLLVWVVAGMISLFGAMAFAELGTLLPQTGGQYVFLKAAYNDFIAYLFGWSGMAVINSASIAAISFVFAQYADYFLHLPRFSPAIEHGVVWQVPLVGQIRPLENFGVKVLAISLILTFTLINYVSSRLGNALQVAATVVKVAALLLLVGGLLASGQGSAAHFTRPETGFSLHGWPLLVGFMAATTGAFASYDGWCNLAMVGGEIRDPARTITRSLFLGLIASMVIYLLLNLAFLYVLPVQAMAASPLVASDAAAVPWGPAGGRVIALLIVISTFGATHVNLLASARIVYAMAETGAFFPAAGQVHRRYRTPGNAILILGIWSALLVVSGSFDILADMFIFMSWVFYFLAILGVFILRRRMPDAERPYRVWGYPYVPAVFLVFTLIYLGSTLYYDITNYLAGRAPVINSVFGLLLTAAGVPFYFWFRRLYRRRSLDAAGRELS